MCGTVAYFVARIYHGASELSILIGTVDLPIKFLSTNLRQRERELKYLVHRIVRIITEAKSYFIYCIDMTPSNATIKYF